MPFADELIGASTAEALAKAVARAAPDARATALDAAAAALAPLPLRGRSDLLRDALLDDVPGSYATLAATVRRAAAADPEGFGGWLIWPVTSAVAVKAVDESTEVAFVDALDLLAELTPRLTSEFAIRTLLEHDLEHALRTISTWTTSPDPHVRRLASEGTRPYLPWAKRVGGIVADPGRTLPILNALYRDDSEYVRRSVANHLNDLSRIRPDLVVETAAHWLSAADDNTPRVVRHGLRTLIKSGHPEALLLLGFAVPAQLGVEGPVLSTTSAAIGESVQFTARVTNTGKESADVAVDYVVHHLKANGKQTGKTFKLATRTIAPGESVEFSRGHSFRRITTRRYHPGVHAIELQVNGVRFGRADFVLRDEESPAAR
ncbi:DNA alkylation repair protein [Streptomyces sp. NPDC096176]|uniref:DNA alkylation repair protein n=1 Tax=Streptomyces sp. NPDC096176 TaxID=3366079 RepID=UPI00380566B0